MKKSDELNSVLIVLGLYIVCFVCGTFFDLQISQALYSKTNIIGIFFTLIGTYPFFICVIYCAGFVLGHNSLLKFKDRLLQNIICIIVACVFILFVGGSSTTLDGFGMLLPALTNMQKAIIIIVSCIVLGVTAVVYGYSKGKKSSDEVDIDNIYKLMLCLVAGFILLQVLKNFVHRPRYRLTLQNLPGVGFTPWHRKIDDILLLQEKYGFATEEIRSFPSGHGYCSISTLAISIMFAKNKRIGILSAVVFSMLVMLSRIMQGAHYLSDVTGSAIIGIILCIIYIKIRK